jgi:hypothetical protein
VVASWRARAKGGALHVELTSFCRLPEAAVGAAEAEAARLAPLRSCSTAVVTVA